MLVSDVGLRYRKQVRHLWAKRLHSAKGNILGKGIPSTTDFTATEWTRLQTGQWGLSRKTLLPPGKRHISVHALLEMETSFPGGHTNPSSIQGNIGGT